MAKYNIRYSCGHTEERPLFGKHEERERIIENAEKHGTCSACRKAEARIAAEATEAALELPPLIGSEKQIAWARTIRSALITKIDEHLSAKRRTVPEDKLAQFEERRTLILQGIYSKDRASWWIDQRGAHETTIIDQIYEQSAT